MDGYFGNFTIRKAAVCWKRYSESYTGQQVPILVVKTCTPAADTGEKQGEAGMKHGGPMVTTSTPGEKTGKWRKKKTRQQTVPLPEHLGERGVAVIWPGGRRGAGQGRAGRGEERVNHTEGETGLLEGCDWKRVKAASKQVERSGQTMKFVQWLWRAGFSGHTGHTGLLDRRRWLNHVYCKDTQDGYD